MGLGAAMWLLFSVMSDVELHLPVTLLLTAPLGWDPSRRSLHPLYSPGELLVGEYSLFVHLLDTEDHFVILDGILRKGHRHYCG